MLAARIKVDDAAVGAPLVDCQSGFAQRVTVRARVGCPCVWCGVVDSESKTVGSGGIIDVDLYGLNGIRTKKTTEEKSRFVALNGTESSCGSRVAGWLAGRRQFNEKVGKHI